MYSGKLIDMHSHILPNADHGCSSVSMSVNLVRKANDCGVEAIAATPHFYMHKSSVDSFIERRDRSYENLMEGLDRIGLGDYKIYKGAEVFIETDLIDLKTEDLAKLCYENTDYILLEMPFVTWSNWVYKTIDAITYKHGLKPVIAHIERYSEPVIKDIFDEGHVAQFNADFATGFFSRRELVGLLNDGAVHIMGSDAHNEVKRNYDSFIKASKKLPAELLEILYNNSKTLLSNGVIS